MIHIENLWESWLSLWSGISFSFPDVNVWTRDEKLYILPTTPFRKNCSFFIVPSSAIIGKNERCSWYITENHELSKSDINW